MMFNHEISLIELTAALLVIMIARDIIERKALHNPNVPLGNRVLKYGYLLAWTILVSTPVFWLSSTSIPFYGKTFFLAVYLLAILKAIQRWVK